MTRSLRFGLAAYRALLLLYPSDLRQAFGAEMVEMFGHDLAAARDTQRLLRIWRTAISEVLRLAVPAWRHTPAVAVPALSVTAVLVANSPLLIISLRWPSHHLLFDTLSALATAASIAGFTSFLAIHRWRGAALISLRLT